MVVKELTVKETLGLKIVELEDDEYNAIMKTLRDPFKPEIPLLYAFINADDNKIKNKGLLNSKDGKVYIRDVVNYEKALKDKPTKIIDFDELPVSVLAEELNKYENIALRFYTKEIYELDKKRDDEWEEDEVDVDLEKFRLPEEEWGIRNSHFLSPVFKSQDKREFYTTLDNGKRVKVTMEVEEMPKGQLYALPLGFQKYCFNCPHAYHKTTGSISKKHLTRKGSKKKIDAIGGEIFSFRCDLDICDGLMKQPLIKDRVLKVK